MAITLPEGPAAQQTIAAAVAELRHHGGAGVFGGAGPIHAAPALGVYVLDLKALIDKGISEGARQVGWRYLLMTPELAVADAATETRDGNTTPRFSSVTHGLAAARLDAASTVAETEYGGSTPRYQHRILEVPALGITALWLHAPDDDRFIPYLGTEVATPRVEEAFDNKLREHARHRLQRS